jgi:hypothetical protein
LLLVAAVLTLAALSPVLARNFGQVTLRGGETQTVSIFGPGGYQRVRVCNDAQSLANVKVTIRPREAKLLQPGLCTEESGDQIEFVNQGAGQAVVEYDPAPGSGSGFGMFGNGFRIFGD